MWGCKPWRISAAPLIVALTFLAVLTGCNSNDPSPEYLRMIVQEAVNNPARPEADQALDDKRKPSEVLIFLFIEPGMKVLDVFAGGGILHRDHKLPGRAIRLSHAL